MAATVRPGQRCVTKDGWYGTVRYVGAVPPTKGKWVGVEWDDPSRGKHSGTHEGVQYFMCKKPDSGSFVREKSLNLGKDFVTVLKERYCGNSSDSTSAEDEEELMIHGKVVEIVGVEKIIERHSHLDRLKEVELRDTDLSWAGEDGGILKTAPNIEHLNLSTNLLLPSWSEVAVTARQLPRLVQLKLSENVQMVFPQMSAVPTPDAFKCLKRLYLAKMQLNWDQVNAALLSLPVLEELHVCKNNIDELGDIDPARLASIRVLNFEDNCLAKWSEVKKLAVLPRLSTLIWNGNGLDHIDFSGLSASSVGEMCFTSLQSISLSWNSFVGWSTVNDIGSMPSLIELRFQHNPVLDGETPFHARQLVIARIGQLQILNGSPITADERLLAERYYLKRYASRWAGSRGNDEPEMTFAAEHPRYNHLVAIHGAPEEALIRVNKATALKDQLVAVTISCPDGASSKEINKKLPGNMTVQKLRGLVHRLFKVDTFEQDIFYFNTKANREFELDDDLRTLSFYSIKNGDRVIVRRK